MAAHWYIVHAYSNFENKVAQSIKDQAAQRGLSDKFEEILVPMEKVVEVRRGKKVDAERKFFPGYVLVKCDLTDDVFHLIKNVPKVTGFLGARQEAASDLGTARRCRSRARFRRVSSGPKPSVHFDIGEQVRVSDGPFATFNGTVEEIDEDARPASRSRCRSSAVRPRSSSNTGRSRSSELSAVVAGT